MAAVDPTPGRRRGVLPDHERKALRMAHGNAIRMTTAARTETRRRDALARQVLTLFRRTCPPERPVEFVLASDITGEKVGPARVVIDGPDALAAAISRRAGRGLSPRTAPAGSIGPSEEVRELKTSGPAGRGRAASRAILSGAASIATVIVIVGITVAVFFNPLWISFEQDRAGVPEITGYTPQQIREATGSILADLFLGPPHFAVAVNGQPVLDAAERSHMVDVRTVLLGFGVVVGVALVALATIVAAKRRSAWAWRAVARGSAVLAVAGVAIGLVILFFFDAAFLLFHLVFFPQGNFSFDPRTERLTQLFPDQFWIETSFAIAVVGLAFAVAVTAGARLAASRLAHDRGRGHEPAPPTPVIGVLEEEVADLSS